MEEHRTVHTHTQPVYGSLNFVRDNPGEPVPKGTFCHLLDFLEHNEDNTGTHTNNLDGLPPPRLIGAPVSAIPTIFMPDTFPGKTLPIYAGLGQAPNMLACIPGGFINRWLVPKPKTTLAVLPLEMVILVHFSY